MCFSVIEAMDRTAVVGEVRMMSARPLFPKLTEEKSRLAAKV